jgi:hypothetical protein
LGALSPGASVLKVEIEKTEDACSKCLEPHFELVQISWAIDLAVDPCRRIINLRCLILWTIVEVRVREGSAEGGK